jgi:hypothetical protein
MSQRGLRPQPKLFEQMVVEIAEENGPVGGFDPVWAKP